MGNGSGISVVISTRNRVQSAIQTLSSIAQSTASTVDWELVVVAHNCTDGTEEILRQTFPALPMRIITHQGRSHSAAKNRALDDLHKRYQERLVIMTDDDVSVAEDWLEQMRNAACRWGSRYLFGGPIEPVFPVQGTLIEGLMRYRGLASQLFAQKRAKDSETLTTQEPFGPNMAFWLSSSRGIRFDPQFGLPDCLGEETLLLREMARGGRRYLHVPSTQVRHRLRPEQLTLEWVERRIRQYAITQARFLFRDPESGANRRRIRRLGRRATTRRLRQQIIMRLPDVDDVVLLRMHLRALQAETARDEYLRLLGSAPEPRLETDETSLLSSAADGDEGYEPVRP